MMPSKSSTKSCARMIDAEYQAILRDRGRPNETFVSPVTGEIEANRVLISVKALNDLNRAIRGEDTIRIMKRSAKGGA